MPNPFHKLLFLLHISRSHAILRRYFVVNGFDGALTMLGLNMGFYVGERIDPAVALTACLGTAIALGMSGLSSAYISESAERRKWLQELEDAMITDLKASAHGTAARIVPLLVALVNGAAPLLISLLITLPWWLARTGVETGLEPVQAAIGLAFLAVFSLGGFLGRVGNTSWLLSGFKAVVVALVTVFLITLIGSK